MFNLQSYKGPLIRLHWWLDVEQTKKRMKLNGSVTTIKNMPILKQFEWGVLVEKEDHLVFLLPQTELKNVKRLLRMYHKIHKVKYLDEYGHHVIGALCDDCKHEKQTDTFFKEVGFKRSLNSDCVWVLGEL